MNFVPCIAWVPRCKAATSPEKLQLSSEELKQLVNETKEQCKKNSLEEYEEEFSDENSENEDENSEDGDENSAKEDRNISGKLENDHAGNEINDDEDFDARYNLDDYDNDDEQNPLFTINDIAVHVDNHDDKYLTDEESEGDLEDKEDYKIKDSDNLIITGHVEDSSSVLEIHVYNQEDDDFYVHHDIVLPSYPLSLAWLDFHPGEEEPGNYVAVGDMGSVIKIYDVDVVDVLEPEFCLGKKNKKEKAKKKEKTNFHTDAVLSLSWNKNVRNLLASGSADSSVIIWDLSDGTVLSKLVYHSNKVQALEWHPTESQFLLSGCTDGYLKLYDCQSEGECKTWKVNGEIEKIIWHTGDSFVFFCSTDQGFIYAFDIRHDVEQKVWQGHKEAITGLDMSPLKPNMLISASMDRTLKVWDLDVDCRMIKSLKLKVGSIYAAKAAPDLDLTVAVGGNNASNSLKVIDIFRENRSVENNIESKESEDIPIKGEVEGMNIKTEVNSSMNNNKRKFYDISGNFKTEDIKNETAEGIRIKTEKKSPKKTNTKKTYGVENNIESKESKDIPIKGEVEGMNIKTEVNSSMNNNKRKFYDISGNFKTEDIKNETAEGISIKTEKKSPKKTNTKKTYDLEEKDTSGFQIQTSLPVAEKQKKQKKSKRKQ